MGLPFLPSPSLRRPTLLSFQRSSVNLSNTLGTVLLELVLGLDMPPPLLTTSVLSSVMEISCAKSSDTSPLLLNSSPNSLNSAEMDKRCSFERHQLRIE